MGISNFNKATNITSSVDTSSCYMCYDKSRCRVYQNELKTADSGHFVETRITDSYYGNTPLTLTCKDIINLLTGKTLYTSINDEYTASIKIDTEEIKMLEKHICNSIYGHIVTDIYRKEII